jgi:hypothetical protein
MPNDLEELFNRQPPYTDEELDKIIAYMRDQRTAYDRGEKPKKATGLKTKAVDLTLLGLAKPKEVKDIEL